MQTVIRGWSATTVGGLDISVQAMVTDWIHGFYPARVRKSLALKILVSAAD